MKKFEITYFAPYSFANFKTTAATLEEAVKKLEAFNEQEGYDIMNREIKTLKFDGKPINTNQI